MEDAHVAVLLEDFGSKFKAFGEALEGVTTKVVNLGTELRMEMAATRARVDILGAKIDGVAMNVAGLKTDAAVLKTDMADVKDRLTGVEHRLNRSPSAGKAPVRKRRS